MSYKGGGYDGCHWEWNFAYFGPDGAHYSLYHSGCFGCPTLIDLINSFLDNPRDFEFYDVATEEGRNSFADRESVRNVLLVQDRLAELELDVPLHPRCEVCGIRVDPEECIPGGYAGAGGVEYHPFEIVCTGCGIAASR